jgi:hypothetical protein
MMVCSCSGKTGLAGECAIKEAGPGLEVIDKYADDRWAPFIKLSLNCGSALVQTSSDSRSTGVLRFGVFHARVVFHGRSVIRPAVLCGFSM